MCFIKSMQLYCNFIIINSAVSSKNKKQKRLDTIYPLFTVVIISMTEHFSEGLGNFLLFIWPSGSKDL